METKERDLFTTMVASPNASLDDLIVAGYNLDNTALLNKDIYKNDDWVLDLFKDQYGNFDDNKFNNYYNLATSYYNNLSYKTSDEIISNDITYHRSNYTAPEDKKRTGPDFQEFKMANPYEQAYGLITPGIVENPTKSIDELALSHKVLANPTTAGPNFENAKWEDSPNGHFWKYFPETLVLALYDEDGEHKDPFTGQIVKHLKGELRLNDEGQFYYERLDGRTVYGRKVLNKLNVITTDGSKLNEYDFFDSDDLELKSIIGTTLKNLALVGSMWLPYIGPVVLGTTLAVLLSGLAATIGKMVVGSENTTLSALEGWAQSMNRQGAKSEYAQQHPIWCWESFIDMIGDFAEIGRVQRFLFADVPSVFTGGKNLLTEHGLKAMLEKLTEVRRLLNEAKIATLVKDPKAVDNYVKGVLELRNPSILALLAQSDLAPLVKNYLKIGEIISRGYMALSVGSNAYAEAKTAGASDIDATLLTLGYMGALYGFLSLGINKFIFPELRAEGYRTKAIAKALLDIDKDTQRIQRTLESASLLDKKMRVHKMFNLGKRIANAEYANGTRTLAASAASGLGMAVEGTGFELLSDLSKGCYDVVKWLQGEDHRMEAFGYIPETGEWDVKGTLSNYTGTFLSAALGGSLTNLVGTYKGMRSLKGITHLLALNELTNMIRNGQADKFLRDVSKLELAPSTLSSETMEVNGETIYVPGTKNNNQNVDTFRMINQVVSEIKEILQAYGGDLSDDSFLTRLTLGDIRFAKIFSGVAKGASLNEYNIRNVKNIKLIDQIRGLELLKKDLNRNRKVEDYEERHKNEDATLDKQISELKEQLKEIAKQILDLINGKRSYEFINASLFESLGIANDFIEATFQLYCENKFGKKYEELTETERKNTWDEYEIWKSSTGRDKIMDLAKIFNRLCQESSNSLTEILSSYKNVSEDLNKFNEIISKLYLTLSIKGYEEAFINANQNNQDTSQSYVIDSLIKLFGNPSDIKVIDLIVKNITEINDNKNLSEIEKDKLLKELYVKLSLARRDTFNVALNNIIKPFTDRGYITSEAKLQILRAFDSIKKYTNDELTAVQNGILVVDDINSYLDIWNDILGVRSNFARARATIELLTESPLEKNINLFLYSIKGDSLLLSELMLKLNKLLDLNSDNITNFLLDQNTLNELLNAINTIKLYRASLLAARTDAVGIDNIYGYNTTLNEISKKLDLKHPELAELPSEIVDILVSDIDSNLNKLIFLRNLYYINKGLKLSLQNRIATHSEMLMYNRMRAITSIKENDPLSLWKGFTLLKAIVDSMQIHNVLHETSTNNVSSEHRKDFEKEKIRMEDAIYEFFQENQDKVNDINKLMELINPLRLQLYTNADNLLNEELTAIDDNSFLWWMASRAAIKSSDFYYQYSKILGFDPRIAPIATQEHSVFISYANIMNGDIFTRFGDALRKSIVKDWKNKTIDERKLILQSLGLNKSNLLEQVDFISLDNLTKYCLMSLPAIRYKNIVFVEGISGSGKTSAVIRQVVELLKQTNPDLLNNILIVHGTSKESAENLKNDIGIEGDVYDRTSFMTFLSKDWNNFIPNRTTGIMDIPKTAVSTVEDNISEGVEVKASASIGKKTEIPNLIIIDEIGLFSTYDVDVIQEFASEYGITVITAGDLDLTHIIGKFDVNLGGMDISTTATLERTMFVRSSKLGVSMRTDNSAKTKNLSNAQLFLRSDDVEVSFDWFKNKNGLYGDKVIKYTIDAGQEDYSEGINEGKEEIIDEVIKEVDYLISTLLENEKIGYIYSDEESPIYKKLCSSKYKNLIDFKQGNLSQGLEGQYYIVECDDPYANDYKSRIYTGMTRARLGSLLVISSYTKISSKEVLEVIGEKITKETIAKYTTDRKELLKEILPIGENIDYKKRTLKDNSVITKEVVKELKKDDSTDNLNPAVISLLIDNNEIDKKAFNKQIEEVVIPYLTEHLGINSPEDFISDNTLLKLFDEYPDIQTLIKENKADDFIKELINQANNTRVKNSFDINGLFNLPPFKDLMKFMDDDTKKEFIDIITNEFIPYIIQHPEILKEEGNPLLDNDEVKGMFAKSDAIIEAFKKYHKYLLTNALTKLRGYDNNPLEEYWELFEGKIEQKILPYLINNPSILSYDQFMNDKYILENLLDLFNEEISQIPLEFEEFVNGLISEAKIVRLDTKDKLPSEPLTYDLEVPIIDLPVVNTEDVLKDYFEAQLSEDTPETKIEEVLDILNIDGILSTHNSFELGMVRDSDGKFDEGYYSKYFNYFIRRIDSLNGLVKLRYEFNDWNDICKIEVDDIEEMIDDLAAIRSVFFNTKSKSDILDLLKIILGLEENLYVTFAIKKSPKSNDEQEYVEPDGKSTPFSKSKSERTIDNLSRDHNSDEHNITQLVAIIGSKDEGGDFLEIPLSTLPSPITIIMEHKEFEDLKAVLELEYDITQSVYKAVKTVISQFEDDIVYRDIINLCKLYTYGDRLIYFIKDNDWTLAKNAKLLGPLFVTLAGKYLMLAGYKYNENEFTSLAELAAVRGFKLAQDPMVTISGTYQAPDSGKTIKLANIGHTFILISTDDTITSDEDMLNYYANLIAEPNKYPPKILKAYVVPPRATMLEYLENKKNMLIDKSYKLKPIGGATTSYRIFEELLKHREFYSELELLNFYDKEGKPLNVNNLIVLLNNIVKNGSDRKLKDYLLDTKVSGKEWNNWTHSGKEMRLANALDRILINLVYSFEGKGNNLKASPNDEMIDIISKICPEVYYVFKYDKSDKGENGNIKYIRIRNNNWTYGNSKNNVCGISGKIVTPEFLIDLGNEINDFVSGIKTITSKAGYIHYVYPDNNNYIEGYSHYDVSKTQVDDNINYIKSKTSIDVSNIYKENISIKEANLKAINKINLNNLKACAFIINGKIKIGTSLEEVFKGNHLITTDGKYTNDISETKDINGIYHFLVIDNGILYEAEYDGKRELTLYHNQEGNIIPLTKLNTEFNEVLKTNIKEALTSDMDFWDEWGFGSLEDLLNATNQEELNEVIKSYEKDDYRREDLEKLLNNITDSEQKAIIEDLIKLEKNEKLDECPLPIKLIV